MLSHFRDFWLQNEVFETTTVHPADSLSSKGGKTEQSLAEAATSFYGKLLLRGIERKVTMP